METFGNNLLEEDSFNKKINTENKSFMKAIGFTTPILLGLVSMVLLYPFMIFKLQLNVTYSILLTVLGELLIIFFGLLLTNNLQNFKEFLFLKNLDFKNVLKGLSVGLLLYVILQVFYISLNSLGVDFSSSDTSVSLSDTTGFSKFFTLFILAPIVVPFVEEIFFRGFITRMVSSGSFKKSTLVYSALVSSLYFGLAHFQGLDNFTSIFVIVWTFIIGLVNSYLMLKTDSIYTAYASHFMYNFVTSLSMLIILG